MFFFTVRWGKQVKVLEHHAHFPAQAVDVTLGIVDFFPFKPNLPAGGDFQQVQAAEEGAFAGAGGPHNYYLFPFFDFLIDAVEHLVVAKGFFQIFNGYHSCAASFPGSPAGLSGPAPILGRQCPR